MDAERLSHLIEQYSAALTLYARQWCRVPEDVVQDAFVKLAAQRPPPQHVAGWLYRVVRNAAVSARRDEQRRLQHEGAAAARSDAWFEPNEASVLDGRTVTEALAELPLELREPMVAHLWGGIVVCRDRRVDGHVGQYGPSTLPRRSGRAPRKVACSMSEQQHSPEIDALADELRRLVPRAANMDRDATMFRAGRAGTPRRWLWPVATLLASLTAVGLGAALWLQPPPQTVTVYPPVTTWQYESAIESYQDELPSREDLARHRKLRDHLLHRGLDGLPTPPVSAPPKNWRHSDFFNGVIDP